MDLKSILVLFLSVRCASVAAGCELRARTDAGWVCGVKRDAGSGVQYASFRGVPYGKQPLGELRFQELQPVEPWEGYLNATMEGPICPSHNILFGPLMQPQGVSEACIHANIHVPLESLPDPDDSNVNTSGLPILVFIHGGAWVSGSGDADMYGPEYLVPKGIIVVTFNYRLAAFGFLSLDTAKVPGNAGLRDAVTLLRWVQKNARFFGGDPDQVTLVGHSAGSVNAHLLSLSPVATGLFKRVWLSSGTAYPTFYSSSKKYAHLISDAFLTLLDISSTDFDQVHDQLVKLPLEEILATSDLILEHLGLTLFVPVVESEFPNVTAIITEEPVKLIENGIGNNIPMVVGYTSAECESLRPRLEAIDLVSHYENNPASILTVESIVTDLESEQLAKAEKVTQKYMAQGAVTMDNLMKICSDTYFAYPALKLARTRAAGGGAPVYLYKFSYETPYSIPKLTFHIDYPGAAHVEDLSLIFKVNSINLTESNTDYQMRDWMSQMMVNYVIHGDPAATSPNSWPAADANHLSYLDISIPQNYTYGVLTQRDQDMVQFFDNLK